jgi:iron complex transport system substrate-binding protein
MKRVRACWWLLVALMATTVHAQSVSVVDDRGTTVRLAQPARRVVSLLPSLTETVCTLGACDRVVAVDRWSDWPASVQRLPKVGSLDDVNVEAIVALKPDLVLAAPSSRVAERLRGLGLTVAELDAQDMAGVERVLTRIGVLLGRADASRLAWDAVQHKLALAQAQVPPQARGVRV